MLTPEKLFCIMKDKFSWSSDRERAFFDQQITTPHLINLWELRAEYINKLSEHREQAMVISREQTMDEKEVKKWIG